jgi:glucose/arabinose dehydrogenase
MSGEKGADRKPWISAAGQAPGGLSRDSLEFVSARRSALPSFPLHSVTERETLSKGTAVKYLSGPPARSPRLASRLAVALGLLPLLGVAPRAAAQTLPPDFVAEPVGGNWTQPICLCFAGGDDLLVAEKAGLVWDVHDGFKHARPVIDLQQEILNNGDRGLMSIAVDVDWASNGYLYLLYVVDPNQDGNDWEQETFGRLTRYTTYVDANGDLLADMSSRLVLIGETWSQGFPSLHFSHAMGDLRFCSDGSLLVSTGDGAHWDVTDMGGFDPNGFGPGKFDSGEDIGAFRSQSLTSLAGKILRIDPATGLGLPDNPYWTGDPADNRSRIWMTGLRNPFRFTLDPGSGSPERIYASDVGWFQWEEVDRGAGGENLGWPCYETNALNKAYANNNPFGECKDPSIFTKPLLAWNHSIPGTNGYVGNCATGVCVYQGTEYPQSYRGRVFWCDYGQSWIRDVPLVNDKPAQSEQFASNMNGPVDLVAAPSNGDLYYVSITNNQVAHIRYTKTNHPPVALATVAPTFGQIPLLTAFDASASFDPEGGALAYDWDFGDGNHSNLAAASHTYATSFNYPVTLTVTDPGGATGTASWSLKPGDTPPTITSLNSPAPGSFFVSGVTDLQFDASVADAEDDPAGLPLDVKWVIDLVHDHHVHPSWATLQGAQAHWTPPYDADHLYLHVTLIVTDSRGLTATQAFDLYDADAEAEPHVVSLSNAAPRIGHPITATGHLHYPGKGPADLLFDWGDGAVDSFHVSHMQDCLPSHTYAAPGDYTLTLTANDGVATHSTSQSILVRPLAPAVAIFAPLVAPHDLSIDERWMVATKLADEIHTAGYEARIFGTGDQAALQAWMEEYLPDPPRDWLVCLDVGASVVYAGENRGSLAEQWLAAGKGVVWTGFNPFAQYLTTDGTDRHRGAGPYALDELLRPAVAQLESGNGPMNLAADAADLPLLQPYSSACALATGKLNSAWSIVKLYASDLASPPTSDALVVRNRKGGEFAQFFSVTDPTLPREAVLRDFFLTHVYTGLPTAPAPFQLLTPKQRADVYDHHPWLVWGDGRDAKSWRVEVATDSSFTTILFSATVTPTLPPGSPAGGSVPTTATVQVTSDLTQGVYLWRVTASNDYGSTLSDAHGFRVLDLSDQKKKAR